ncbi:helix-turn-helix domain-containing protein [Nocardioides lacusdianchii]|uniref:helix-turn-helix domain-containing protein n=1 Tax=Nocardioides lacusdianchii TaxID=2783664 RepID=UPI001CCA8AED|nr:helix-turn-helix transcriptional regulator [Nocardioides lacusdianchii]
MTPKTTSQREQEERQRVGATLRTIRQTRGWDLGALATQVDISYSYLSNIEAGRKPLTDILLARLATALDVEQIAIKVPTGKTAKTTESADAVA